MYIIYLSVTINELNIPTNIETGDRFPIVDTNMYVSKL